MRRVWSRNLKNEEVAAKEYIYSIAEGCKNRKLACKVYFSWYSVFVICNTFRKIIANFIIPDFFYGSTILVGLGLFVVEVSRSHSDTPHLVGLPWASDQLIAETSTWQHTTVKRDGTSTPPSGIRTRLPSRRAAEDWLYQSVIYFQNNMLVRDTRLNVITFAP